MEEDFDARLQRLCLGRGEVEGGWRFGEGSFGFLKPKASIIQVFHGVRRYYIHDLQLGQVEISYYSFGSRVQSLCA